MFKQNKSRVSSETLMVSANTEMAWVHDEPAYSPNTRMIYVENKEDDDAWLNGSSEQASQLIKPLQDGALDYRPCQHIKSE